MQTETNSAVNTEAPSSPVMLSELAATEVRRYIEEQGAADTAGLRVGVLPGGCSGFQYGLNIEDEPGDDDMTFESQGIRLFVDPFSLQYLQGTEIDFVSTFQGSGFTFNNPNAHGGCGCGRPFPPRPASDRRTDIGGHRRGPHPGGALTRKNEEGTTVLLSS